MEQLGPLFTVQDQIEAWTGHFINTVSISQYQYWNDIRTILIELKQP